jgi:hypothetical protein
MREIGTVNIIKLLPSAKIYPKSGATTELFPPPIINYSTLQIFLSINLYIT